MAKKAKTGRRTKKATGPKAQSVDRRILDLASGQYQLLVKKLKARRKSLGLEQDFVFDIGSRVLAKVKSVRQMGPFKSSRKKSRKNNIEARP